MATVQAMLIEFGPAEPLDSFLARPLLMYLTPGLLNDLTTGIVAGKLAADIVSTPSPSAPTSCGSARPRATGPWGNAGSSAPTPTLR